LGEEQHAIKRKASGRKSKKGVLVFRVWVKQTRALEKRRGLVAGKEEKKAPRGEKGGRRRSNGFEATVTRSEKGKGPGKKKRVAPRKG